MSVIRRYEVDICDDCIEYKGEMCHTPGCVLIRLRTAEIKEWLSQLLIRFQVDGEDIRLQPDATIVSIGDCNDPEYEVDA